jgi:hypothetical protein
MPATYFDNRLDAADWTAATADNKAASLITATGWLDTPCRGYAVS